VSDFGAIGLDEFIGKPRRGAPVKVVVVRRFERDCLVISGDRGIVTMIGVQRHAASVMQRRVARRQPDRVIERGNGVGVALLRRQHQAAAKRPCRVRGGGAPGRVKHGDCLIKTIELIENGDALAHGVVMRRVDIEYKLVQRAGVRQRAGVSRGRGASQQQIDRRLVGHAPVLKVCSKS